MAVQCSFLFIPCMLLLSSLVAAGAATITDGELLSSMIGVQGLIYCKQGSKLTPLQGNFHHIYNVIMIINERGFIKK